jgi:hypothetical protein
VGAPLFPGTCDDCSFITEAPSLPNELTRHRALKKMDLSLNTEMKPKHCEVDVQDIVSMDMVQNVLAQKSSQNTDLHASSVRQILAQMGLNDGKKVQEKVKTELPTELHYHSGQIEVLEEYVKLKYPILFVPFYEKGKLDLLIAGTFLQNLKIGIDNVKAVTNHGELMGLQNIKPLPDLSDDLNVAVERCAIVNLLQRDDPFFLFHLQENFGTGISPETSEFEKTKHLHKCFHNKKFQTFAVETLDHFLDAVQFDQIGDILVAPVSILHEDKTVARISIHRPFSMKVRYICEKAKNLETEAACLFRNLIFNINENVANLRVRLRKILMSS